MVLHFCTPQHRVALRPPSTDRKTSRAALHLLRSLLQLPFSCFCSCFCGSQRVQPIFAPGRSRLIPRSMGDVGGARFWRWLGLAVARHMLGLEVGLLGTQHRPPAPPPPYGMHFF